MSTWTSFYVNTSNTGGVIEQLKTLSGIANVTKGAYPSDFYNGYLFGQEALPDHLAIRQSQPDWVSVRHNTFNYLTDWALEISNTFNCKVIVVMAQSTSDVYYFALYESGKKLREIDVCYGSDDEETNWGQQFSFEKIGALEDIKGKKDFIFDMDTIEEYASHFGLKIFDENMDDWYEMKGNSKQPTIKDYINKHLKPKKPWWQFW